MENKMYFTFTHLRFTAPSLYTICKFMRVFVFLLDDYYFFYVVKSSYFIKFQLLLGFGKM